MKKIIVIVGPTGSGKSDFAIEIAKKFDCEIINADCFQVYKYLDIGVNKTKDYKGVIHHLIDIIEPNEEWDIKKFKDRAESIIDSSKKNIIVTGGSNLYIDCLIKNYNLSFDKRTSNNCSLTNEELFSKISAYDKTLASKIGINNRKRLERSYELLLQDDSMTSCNEKKYEPFIIFINPDRKELYDKINKRVDKMLENNWLDEIKSIVNKYNKNCNALQAIGYKAIIQNDCVITDEIIEKIKQDSRRYAKRQVSWCKNKFNINLEKENNKLTEFDIESIKGFLNE